MCNLGMVSEATKNRFGVPSRGSFKVAWGDLSEDYTWTGAGFNDLASAKKHVDEHTFDSEKSLQMYRAFAYDSEGKIVYQGKVA